MTNLQLDWSTAEVSEGKLTVSLDERPTDEWVASFERTAQLLDHGTWPGVKLKKQEISVKQVEPGSEEKLRFFLESVVQEANAAQGPDDEASEDEQPDEEEPGDEPEDEEDPGADSDPDREMTDQFQSFAGGSEKSSEDS